MKKLYFFAHERFKISLHLNVKIRFQSSCKAGYREPNREYLLHLHNT